MEDKHVDGVVVDKLVHGGLGMVRLATGQVAFASSVVPGDQIIVRSIDSRKGTVFVESWSLDQPSPQRQKPPCQYINRCGGCNWMQIQLPTQQRAKVRIMQETLARAGVKFSCDLRLHENPAPYEYRLRIRLQVSRDHRIGFMSAKSHQVVEVDQCLVAHPRINQALEQLRKAARAGLLESIPLQTIELRFSPHITQSVKAAEQAGHLVAVLRARKNRKISSADLVVLQQHFAGMFDIALAEQPSVETRKLPQVMTQDWPSPPHPPLRVPVDAFVQVCWPVNILMRERLLQLVGAGRKQFLDLFCGAGNFSFPLAYRQWSGTAVDQVPSAITQAKLASKEQSLPLEFICADADRWLSEHLRQHPEWHCDLIVCDPPRRGAVEVARRLRPMHAENIVWFGCDPAALARDIAVLQENGFKLAALELFDMFPQTHHFEAMAFLGS